MISGCGTHTRLSSLQLNHQFAVLGRSSIISHLFQMVELPLGFFFFFYPQQVEFFCRLFALLIGRENVILNCLQSSYMERQIPERNHFIYKEKSLYQKMRAVKILLINKFSHEDRHTFYSEMMWMIKRSEHHQFDNLNLEYLIIGLFLQGSRNI